MKGQTGYLKTRLNIYTLKRQGLQGKANIKTK